VFIIQEKVKVKFYLTALLSNLIYLNYWLPYMCALKYMYFYAKIDDFGTIHKLIVVHIEVRVLKSDH